MRKHLNDWLNDDADFWLQQAKECLECNDGDEPSAVLNLADTLCSLADEECVLDTNGADWHALARVFTDNVLHAESTPD